MVVLVSDAAYLGLAAGGIAANVLKALCRKPSQAMQIFGQVTPH